MKRRFQVRHLLGAVCGGIGLLSSYSCRGDVRMPALFSDNLVLQQNVANPIWGRADPGEAVVVELADRTFRTLADTRGRWKLLLAPMPSTARPLTLAVRGHNLVLIRNVLIGEVWLCSGQSNMEQRVSRAQGYATEKLQADLPQLRVFSVKRAAAGAPQEECEGEWQISNEHTVGNFSATAYYFGSTLTRKLRIPVGLIKSAWGSTPIEAWTAPEANARINLNTILAKGGPAVPSDKSDVAIGDDPATAPAPEIKPGELFNGMIAPLIPFALRGVVWYQGEANSKRTYPEFYGLQLETMIVDWRARWGAELPFAWVQLPDFRTPQSRPSEPSGWVTIREQMLRTLHVPRTGMIVTLGLGAEALIHPTAKREVGQRLAGWALADVYRQPSDEGWGPIPGKIQFEGTEVAIAFEHIGAGLRARNDPLQGFALAGADRQWHWATARIDGATVIVESLDVPHPVAVRYAWADNPQFGLLNSAGLAATPFRSDDWDDRRSATHSTLNP